jgi:hypothetical protein
VVKLARAAVLALPALALMIVARPPAAHAHPESLPTLVNRYISLVVVGDHAELVVTLLHGDLPGGERRRAIDTDHDGAIDERELERERVAWTLEADDLVRARLDDRALPIVPAVAIDLGGDPRVTARPLVVEVSAHIPLAPGRHTFTIEPGADRPRDGETEVTIDLGAPASLVASHRGQGAGAQPAQSRFLFPAPRASAGEDRTVTFVVDSDAGGVSGSRGLAPIAAAVSLAVVLAGATLVLLRRRRR